MQKLNLSGLRGVFTGQLSALKSNRVFSNLTRFAADSAVNVKSWLSDVSLTGRLLLAGVLATTVVGVFVVVSKPHGSSQQVGLGATERIEGFASTVQPRREGGFDEGNKPKELSFGGASCPEPAVELPTEVWPSVLMTDSIMKAKARSMRRGRDKGGRWGR